VIIVDARNLKRSMLTGCRQGLFFGFFGTADASPQAR
jgi:hypothetical protein